MSPVKKHGLPAHERIKHRKILKEVFSSKQTVFNYPFKIGYLKGSGPVAYPQIVVAVPKRVFKRAVDRNRIKRLIKETYRLQKQILVGVNEADQQPISALYIRYIAKEMPEHLFLGRKLNKCLKELAGKTLNNSRAI